MKTSFKIAAILISLSTFSCTDSLLDARFDGSIESEDIWSTAVYAEGVLVSAYSSIPGEHMYYDDDFLDSATDDAVTNQYTSTIYNLGLGGWSPDLDPVGEWSEWSEQIRIVNLWLENGQTTTYYISDELYNTQILNRLQGEAYFLRAWYHWLMLQSYAGLVDGEAMGVPIYTSVDMQDNGVVSRSTYEECVAAIIADCDLAASLLPDQYVDTEGAYATQNLGRANRLGALALKSRVALYAASPAFNLAGDITLWERAALYSLEAIEAVGGTLPTLDNGIFSDINDSEVLYAREGDTSNSLEKTNRIPSNYGSGRTAPSQNLVDAYGDSLGVPISESTLYDAKNPYLNRDPRLYYTIYHNGTNADGSVYDTTEGSTDAAGANIDASRSNYYLNKWLLLGVSLDADNVTQGVHICPLFRCTELWLNYAEALCNAGDTATAIDVIHQIRSRYITVGSTNYNIDNRSYLETVAARGDEDFLELIHNERRLELAFESHRFWDVRRWLLPADQINVMVRGVKIEQAETSGYTYSYINLERRNFYEEALHYPPIPREEVYKGIAQNDGWN